MTPLEIKTKKVELLRVSAAKAEMELRIEQCLDEVKRLEAHIQIQVKKEDELTHLINEAQKA